MGFLKNQQLTKDDALQPISEVENEEHDRTSSVDGSGGEAAENEVKRLAQVETKQIRIWKVMVVLIITFAGAAVSVGINRYLKQQEENDIDESFDLFANTIEDVSRIHFRTLFNSMRALSHSLTTEAQALNMTFPYVTFYNFEVFAHQTRVAAGIEAIGFTPIIETREELQEWNNYSLLHEDWVQASHRLQEQIEGYEAEYEPFQMAPFVYDLMPNQQTGEMDMIPTKGDGPFTPIWLNSPPPLSPYLMKVNTFNIPNDPHVQIGIQKTQDTVLSAATDQFTGFTEVLLSIQRHKDLHAAYPKSGAPHQPHVSVATPVFDSFDRETRKHVGDVMGLFTLEQFLLNLLPDGVRGILVEVRNTCGQTFSFRLDGNQAYFRGEGELLDHEERSRDIVFDFVYEDYDLQTKTPESCIYTFHLHSSDEFEEKFTSDLPFVFAVVVAFIFMVMALTFFMYDGLVSRRNKKVMSAAVRSTAIVTSLFPSQVRDRLYAGEADAGSTNINDLAASSTTRLKRFVDKGTGAVDDDKDDDEVILKSKPIADLFPETTVMFADIAGFTAWSSMREPSQVFMLLETVYRAFDRIAKQRRVFKVETVGDCYVAVAGCPDPMKNHAVVMARFALSCLTTMDTLTKQLEVTLGPDTGDLYMRIGLHSGPVTAGVLRGERARFQLFGDTMNTASRMESTGQAGRIHISEETADLLVAANKQHWLTQRADTVYAKGKGALKTFWLSGEKESSDSRSELQESAPVVQEEAKADSPQATPRPQTSSSAVDAKTQRLIDWNIDVLLRLLKQVVARRISRGLGDAQVDSIVENTIGNSNGSVLGEVKEIIALPHFDANAFKKEQNPDTIVLDASIKEELREYVSSLASMYRNNPFHNFEHASHVTMSVVKLLSRIVAPTDEAFKDDGNVASTMHDHTYGITSDPLTQFACVLSALIHDADHPGVPNAQLVAEGNQLALFYKNQSVAEQNSVDLAWNLLMDDNFKNLRAAIYGTEDEMKRFRQLVVNSVMATDIVDKELKALRNARWEKAFSGKDVGNEVDTVNRKATIVIEHLIQASDVAHTMQHWHIYRKWNERFFMECYKAYKSGRGGDTNPADNWYKGEIGFFDFYIIPLAKKLKECGVFGVSSDEYLNYAQKNRSEWETRGREIVASMVDKVNSETF